MAYPFFHCVLCDAHVQKAVPYEVGRMPTCVLNNRYCRLSDGFDGDDFTYYCRGQGGRYRTAYMPQFVEFIDGFHYNFDGVFHGLCCFCALHRGFCKELFVDVSCYNCKRKEFIRRLFLKVFDARKDSATWETHGWAALPSAVLDLILGFVVGPRCVLVDGEVRAT